MTDTLKAGAAAVDISPVDSQFLFGYPHVKRFSTGVHDPLFSSALYLSDGRSEVIFVANDIIFVGAESVKRVRERIAASTGVPQENIMITGTHTHSGPITLSSVSNEADPVVPDPDPAYVKLMEDGIVAAACRAREDAQPAELGLAVADGGGVGTNRRDPTGPTDPEAPVLMVRSAEDGRDIACMIVYSMHPTVLHEDSTLVSADFPGMTRRFLQKGILGEDCPVVYHTGPSGNQSPRHVTTANTFAEAARLGEMLGEAVARAIAGIEYSSDVTLGVARTLIAELPRKTFPTVAQAEAKLEAARSKLEHLRQTDAPRQETRTAECDWFGAEETLTLARAEAEGRLDEVCRSRLPAEVQIIRVGRWRFVGWPVEIFVEYALDVKGAWADTYVISVANGEMQGYIVTPEAVAEGGYEASNSLFQAETGRILVDKTAELLADI